MAIRYKQLGMLTYTVQKLKSMDTYILYRLMNLYNIDIRLMSLSKEYM